MSKIKVADLLSELNIMLKEHWSYVWGSASKGCVDCSGALVYVFRKYGHSIYHGSNRIARIEVDELLPISQAKPGMAAFKARNPGDAEYALPSSYKSGGKNYNGDLRDFYHVGVVGQNGKVLNAQSSSAGFVESPIKTWTCVGYLTQVDYGDMQEDNMTNGSNNSNTSNDSIDILGTAEVIAESGSTVRMRSRPLKNAPIVANIKVGTLVNILEATSEWCQIEVDGKHGYMMSKFLNKLGSVQESEGDRNDSIDILALVDRVTNLEERVAALESGGVG